MLIKSVKNYYTFYLQEPQVSVIFWLEDSGRWCGVGHTVTGQATIFFYYEYVGLL